MMARLDAIAAARAAVAVSPERPATALLYDDPDARLVVFRLAPGQVVPVHTSTSTVLLQVLEGRGMIGVGGNEAECAPGDVVTFTPEEPHGMRAVGDDTLLLLATITPRPGAR
jgi:quercetin dioxygenase-like cupin family protein